ncbi:MAG: DUF2252 family protein [Alphaproteobacteria bacterium]
MSIFDDTKDYEDWLRGQCAVVEKDLRRKHEKMRADAFSFLRATYYRWARQIEAVCPDLKDAPRVLAVGDAHLENFGTWRDGEGRLVWGVNDFDEGAVMPYPFDLVRLAASARLAPHLAIANGAACKAILDGYKRGLETPRPMLITGDEAWLPRSEEKPRDFWDKIDRLPGAKPPGAVTAALKRTLPQGASALRFAASVRGSGSLGRPRYVVAAAWRGGRVAREAKALVGSAWDWAHGGARRRSRFLDLAEGAYRSPDPLLGLANNFIYRRLAADSHKIDFDGYESAEQEKDLLDAMGFDLGSIHAADARAAKAVRRDLRARPREWLRKASKAAAVAVKDDHRQWAA